jgi:Fur family ferric uptake transcriptional regulator
LSKKTLIFQILSAERGLSATQLQQRAQDAGIELTTPSAYRALRSFRESDGKLEQSDTRCLKAVSSILQNAASGEHLTATDILGRALELGLSLHKATVYRVLARLVSIGLVAPMDRGRQKYYEWKREEENHGHLTCVECGQMIEFHQDKLDFIANDICKRLGYQFQGIEFVVRSLCPTCRDR